MPITQQTDRRLNYNDYLNLSNDQKWEIIDGEIYDMSPAPKVKHQRIAKDTIKAIDKNLNKKELLCESFIAPTDVVFDDFNVVQPDIFIVCDKNKITEDNIQGAPDLIIEIASKSSVYKDTKIKKELYEKFCVKEYIIVFPDLEIVQRYVLENNKYNAPGIFNWDETLKLKAFDIEINMWEIFGKESEKKEKEDKRNEN